MPIILEKYPIAQKELEILNKLITMKRNYIHSLKATYLNQL